MQEKDKESLGQVQLGSLMRAVAHETEQSVYLGLEESGFKGV